MMDQWPVHSVETVAQMVEDLAVMHQEQAAVHSEQLKKLQVHA